MRIAAVTDPDIPTPAREVLQTEPERDVVSSPDPIEIRIVSTPTGATIYEGETVLGTTPMTIVKDARTSDGVMRTFLLKKPGFQHKKVQVAFKHSTIRNVELQPQKRKHGMNHKSKTGVRGALDRVKQ